MTTFITRYAPLDPQTPAWGDIATLPWDEEVFGFSVADFRASDGDALMRDAASCAAALAAWADARGVELVGCSIPAASRALTAALPTLGFAFVEPTLQMVHSGLEQARIHRGLTARCAAPADHAALVTIAGSAFATGRYHADARFPLELAHHRYATWIKRALVGGDPADHVYVVGPVGQPRGFLHVRLADGVANLRLGAVAQSARGGLEAYALWAGSLTALRRAGARSATARVSAMNTPVLNLYAALGFQASEPQVVFHWHGPRLAPPNAW